VLDRVSHFSKPFDAKEAELTDYYCCNNNVMCELAAIISDRIEKL